MPFMDGFQVGERILAMQNMYRNTATPIQKAKMNECEVIAVTAHVDRTVEERCKRIGFAKVLNKPVNFD